MASSHRSRGSRPSRVLAEAAFSRAARAASLNPEAAALHAAIDAGTLVLDIVPPTERRFAFVILNVSSLYGALWQLTRDDEDWRSWTGLVAARVSSIQPGEWRDAVAAHAWAGVLKNRALATGLAIEREQAIDALERARQLPMAAEVDAADLAALASLRVDRFLDLHDPVDLEIAVRDASVAAANAEVQDAVRNVALETVTGALQLRAEATNSEDDLLVAIGLGESLLEDVQQSPRFSSQIRDLVASLLRRRFAYSRDAADLERAIVLRKQLLDGPLDDSERAALLDNLGNLYGDRFKFLHERRDLEAAIEASKEALSLARKGDAARNRILANYALTLGELFVLSHDEADSKRALECFREGLANPALTPEMRLRLQVGMSRHLVLRSVLLERASDLDDAINELRHALSLALEAEGKLPVAYRLGQRSRAGGISRLLTGTLVRRGQAARGRSGDEDLAEALAVAEATKSPLLVQALLQRTQVTDPDSADGFVEGQQLSLLGALDAAELAVVGTGAATDRQISWMKRRADTFEWLQALWARCEAESEKLADRVARIKYPVSLVLDGVLVRDDSESLLAICDLEDVDSSGGFYRGQCALFCPAGLHSPELLYLAEGDPLPGAATRLAREIADDAGRGATVESWHEDLARRLAPRTISGGQVVVASPSSTGMSIPWSLALERCGWRTDDGSPLAVFTVPSIAVLALPEPDLRWHTPLDMAELIGETESPEETEDTTTPPGVGLLRSLVNPDEGTPPVVIGNPTSDLPASAREARDVATILNVDPLLGEEATVNATVGRLSASSVIHIAAHAGFVADAPLQSHIRLADGDLPARRLVGNSSQARLVVLSACEAGKGASLVGSEVLGLVAALTRTGVGAVVASVWSVDDASTAHLMRCFHRFVADGVEPVNALAKAQAHVREQSGWSAPYFWAGFVIAGRAVQQQHRASAQ